MSSPILALRILRAVPIAAANPALISRGSGIALTPRMGHLLQLPLQTGLFRNPQSSLPAISWPCLVWNYTVWPEVHQPWCSSRFTTKREPSDCLPAHSFMARGKLAWFLWTWASLSLQYSHVFGEIIFLCTYSCPHFPHLQSKFRKWKR